MLHEVDRQLCYELSERFEIAEQLEPQAGTVRVGVTYIRPTHQVGSAAAAVANFFIPGPIKVRAPGGTGGLGAEAELLAPDGRQAAAVVWRRDAMVVGTDKPSLSRIGDAHQLAEPLGDMVTDSAGATTEIVGAGTGYGANAAFAVTRLDASDIVSQVLVSTFTGGAHCCSVLTVVESRDGAWRTYDLGSWDGDTPAMPRDLDGDGVKEFRFVDQAFLYAFASYAESWAPPVIQNRVDGRIEDVSKASVYRPVFDKAAADSRIACLERSNGACAAYVASAARAGRLDGAWAEMLDAYDQASDWTLPTACRVRTSGSCPVGAEMTFSTFPEALQWFLGEHGYTRKVYIAPLDATGPSYDCGAARTVSERAICRSSDLAMLDRTLAVAYSRAMALARDRAALRATQRSFHQPSGTKAILSVWPRFTKIVSTNFSRSIESSSRETEERPDRRPGRRSNPPRWRAQRSRLPGEIPMTTPGAYGILGGC